MQVIDEDRLETDVAYRFGYLADFMGFGADEVRTLHAAAEWLKPHVPALVDAIYDKLFAYDATKRHFLPRQSGYDGPVANDLASLSTDHEVIQFRKNHLGRYVTALVTRPYDAKMVGYLDMVGKMHTPWAGSPDLDVPLVQMNALLGFLADALTRTIFSLGLERDEEMGAIRAFTKVLWIQNDLVNRHYQRRPAEAGVA